eukprot:Tbor_TRINITY_DN5650_c0_g1::TRINITY_DN5650_c0_g1_i1::g.8989::m.8989/K06234/RAB23; Ras-related protein Rab-23
MSLDNLDDSLKVIVVGDGNVGKTSMLRRYVKGTYTEQYKKTIGAEYLEKEVFLKDLNQSATLMLWDTAGQEVFNALTAAYYRGASAAIFAFSTIDRDSFMNIKKWKEKVVAQCGDSIVMVLCQTKFDLMKEAAVTKEEAEKLATDLNLAFFRISTKDDFNVSQLFEFVAKMCLSQGVSVEGGITSITSGTSSETNLKKDKKDKSREKNEKHEKNKKDKSDKKERGERDNKDKVDDTPKPVNMSAPLRKKEKKKRLCFLV